MSFDVLSRAVCLNTHHLIEASAGTGKTFTIEHLFVRRLIEPTAQGEYVTVSQIAAITFTRAVARELVARIRRSLDQAIHHLSHLDTSDAPEYLKQLEGDAIKQARWRLQTARAELEFAKITTIHGFCFQLLTEFAENQGIESPNSFLTASQMREMVEAFFATQLSGDRLTIARLARLLSKYQYDFQELCRAVIAQLQALWFDEKPDRSSLLPQLHALIKEMKQEHDWSEISVLNGIEELSSSFAGCRKRTGELSEDLQKSMTFFAKLFASSITDKDVENALKEPFLVSSFFSTPKVGKKIEENGLLLLLKRFDPVLHELSDPEAILEEFAFSCRSFVREQMRLKQLFSHDELLCQMEKALEQESFLHYLGSRFSAVIVDEFQDTDPLQWKIIKGILEQEKATVFLVGDPKQAIYSFRKADVYSYIQAKKEIAGAKNEALCTNFRSSTPLIASLNRLFVGPHSKLIFFLPRLRESLEIPTLLSGGKQEKFESTKKPIHFFMAKEAIGRKRSWPTKEMESDFLFPFIAQEIALITKESGSYSQCAVLVKDRHQAERLEAYFSSLKMPARAWRRASTIHSRAHKMLERLLLALISPKDRSRLLQFLSSEPLNYSDEECLKLQDERIWAEHVLHLLLLKKSYEEGGLPSLLQQFLSRPWTKTNVTAMQEVINDLPSGAQLLFDLELFFDLLLERIEQSNLEQVLDVLLMLKELSLEEQEQFTSRFDNQEEAVQIVTMHSSKGLEFDYVFALGLASRSPFPAEAEEEAEKLRQFYVACTRAKERLYLPLVIDEDQKEPQSGTASPMELFMTYLDLSLEDGGSSFDRLNDRKYIYEQMAKNGPTRALDYLCSGGEISVSDALKEEIELPKNVAQKSVEYVDLLRADYKRLYLRSFTSMKTHANHRLQSGSKEEGRFKGVEAGIILHELLATIFRTGLLDDANIQTVVQSAFLQEVEEEVFQMVRAVFHTPLICPKETFCLSEINLKKSFCEMEFLEEVGDGVLTRGVIDFIFEKEGVTYLVDWKSTWLGDEVGAYSQENLRKAVVQNQYDLQAQLYSRAWLRYLDSFEDVQRPKFGGFFFFFLRGLQPDSSGVLFLNPEEVI